MNGGTQLCSTVKSVGLLLAPLPTRFHHGTSCPMENPRPDPRPSGVTAFQDGQIARTTGAKGHPRTHRIGLSSKRGLLEAWHTWVLHKVNLGVN